MLRLSKDRKEKFESVAASSKAEWAVIGHLDPDSIACMKRFVAIGEKYGKKCHLCYFGVWDNPQNKYLRSAFNLSEDFMPLKTFMESHSPETYDCVLLDSSSLNDRRLGGAAIDPIIIIDHHPRKNAPQEKENTWYWIEPCGAAVSLVAKLALSLGIKFKTKEEKEIATLVVTGIMTDTDRLTSQSITALDMAMHYVAHLHADQNIVEASFRAVYDQTYFNFENKSRQNFKLQNGIAISCLEYIDREAVGYMPFIADGLLRYENIKTVYIWAIAGDGQVHIKIRSRDTNLELNQHIKEKFGENYGGGRAGRGSVELPLGFWTPGEDTQEECLAHIKKKLNNTILASAAEK